MYVCGERICIRRERGTSWWEISSKQIMRLWLWNQAIYSSFFFDRWNNSFLKFFLSWDIREGYLYGTGAGAPWERTGKRTLLWARFPKATGPCRRSSIIATAQRCCCADFSAQSCAYCSLGALFASTSWDTVLQNVYAKGTAKRYVFFKFFFHSCSRRNKGLM